MQLKIYIYINEQNKEHFIKIETISSSLLRHNSGRKRGSSAAPSHTTQDARFRPNESGSQPGQSNPVRKLFPLQAITAAIKQKHSSARL